MDYVRFVRVCAVASVMLGATHREAHADEDEVRAGARATAIQGARAMQQERWADAVVLFKKAESLVHAPPHLLYLARAYVKLGKLVEAREAYLKIIREDLGPSAPKAFVDAKNAAVAEEEGLAARLAKLTIVVQGQGADQATVTMDGVAVPRALVGVSHPVNPGAHVLVAKSRGWTSDEVSVKLDDAGARTVTLALTHPAPIAESSPDPAARPKTALRTAGWVTLGVGVLGLGAGTFFLLQNRSKRDESAALCPGPVCAASSRPQMTALEDEADQAATFSWIGYGVGAAGLVAGATLLVLSRPSSEKRSPDDPPAEKAASITPWFGLGSAGVVGRF